jgi:ComF family protein
MKRRLTESGPISRLVSLYHFEKEGTLQSVIHQLKYDGMTRLGVELGRKLGEKLLADPVRTTIDGVIPVPLHSTKQRERGYNQSEYIARGIREVTNIPVYASVLKRHKYTASQTQLTAVERKENVGDAFAIYKRARGNVEGKTYLIVDDVITTGATIEACAEQLKNSGALEVIAGSVALAEHSALP